MMYCDEYDNFIPWQPSTWPSSEDNPDFTLFLRDIFELTIISEIGNVISDAQKVNKSLSQRGHVVALALLCAVDTLSSYAYSTTKINSTRCLECGRGDDVGTCYRNYINDFFPNDYQPHASKIYSSYRNAMVHSWNLFSVGILPGNEEITENDGIVVFGLINFFNALKVSVKNFLTSLASDAELQSNCKNRYERLRNSAMKVN